MKESFSIKTEFTIPQFIRANLNWDNRPTDCELCRVFNSLVEYGILMKLSDKNRREQFPYRMLSYLSPDYFDISPSNHRKNKSKSLNKEGFLHEKPAFLHRRHDRN
ncbi:hypothetical protein M153_4180005845 [Pseudoloma neurophilia]|uniref:Uncharacterized protein n=1 Tax=Pseudoloma neurophilia TaxID=146866 RepID=A0A0R0M549_9MICR|nr:hypothetical protein M153_4180005845 [Pseudoloma neurophilia]